MQFRTLLRATVDGEIIYFDGDGMLYEKHPVRSHYTPTGRRVYLEYYDKPIKLLTPYNGAVGVEEYDVDYTVDDEQLKQIKGDKTTQ